MEEGVKITHKNKKGAYEDMHSLVNALSRRFFALTLIEVFFVWAIRH